MEKYHSFLTGKKIIFVGPCPNIKGSGMGTKIDEYDVVVRTNNAFPVPVNLQADYGLRCDVLYTNCQYYRTQHPLPIKKLSQLGLKFLCMKSVLINEKRNYQRFVGVRRIPSGLCRSVNGALMGVLALADMLIGKPNSIHLTAIDFYASKLPVFKPGDYREYYEGYLPENIIQEANINNIGKRDGHNQVSNTKYIYGLWKKGLVTMDREIEDLMITIVKSGNEIRGRD